MNSVLINTNRKLPKILIEDFNSEIPKNIPIYGITFFEALEYCNWLSINENYEPCYKINEEKVIWIAKANGYRLLTEAEWEYAASAGRNDKDILSDNIDAVRKYLSFVSKNAYRNEDFLPHEIMQNGGIK